ncbi:hypothetical protein [Sphingomonas sp. GB1N7]|uniref:hypothetical protein n=1 Tax=Parasphingomonas caseinilytica TaxID=3096158 RepID=UPI002FC913E6
MAYLGIEEMYSGPSTDLKAAPVSTGFTALEWSVIALAKKDSIGSLKAPGRMSRALGTVFGRGVNSRLAEPRLEMLRRVAVYAWRRGYALPASEVSAFLRAGFSMAQAEVLVASITGGSVGQLAWKVAA